MKCKYCGNRTYRRTAGGSNVCSRCRDERDRQRNSYIRYPTKQDNISMSATLKTPWRRRGFIMNDYENLPKDIQHEMYMIHEAENYYEQNHSKENSKAQTKTY